MEDTLEFKVFFKPHSVVTVKLGTRANIFGIYFMILGGLLFRWQNTVQYISGVLNSF